MDLITKVAKRIGEAFVDAAMTIFSHAVNIVLVFAFALLIHFVPVWIVLSVIIFLLALIVYLTYRQELDDITEED